MGWFQIILLIFRYGPTFIKVIREIFEMICSLRKDGDEDEAKSAEASLKDALNDYKKTKDRARIDGLRDRLRKRCRRRGDCPVQQPPDDAA